MGASKGEYMGAFIFIYNTFIIHLYFETEDSRNWFENKKYT